MARATISSQGVERGASAHPAEAHDLLARLDDWETDLAARDRDDAFVSAWERVAADIASLPTAEGSLLETEWGRRVEGRLAPHQRRYLAIAERLEAENLLRLPSDSGSLHDLVGSTFGKQTLARLAEAETLIDLGGTRRVIVVGCGAFPAAAFFFHERTAAQITALEMHRPAADLATAIAERYASGRLEIRCEDGRDHDYGAADLVYVVNQVTPKPDVLHRIAATAGPGVRLLARDPLAAGRLLADSLDRHLPEPWRISAAGAVDPTFLSRHVLLVRGEDRGR